MLVSPLKRGRVPSSQNEPQTTDYRQALKQAMERAKQDPKWGKSRFTKGMAVEFSLHETNKRTVFDYADTKRIIIGRLDSRTEALPHVDLSAFDGSNQGVSRRHAAVERHDDVLFVNDLGSRNGTYLNGKLVKPNNPRILRSGDEIRIGYLLLLVKYKQAE